MAQFELLAHWNGALLKSTSLAEASAVLAEGAAAMSSACAAGTFLLEQTGQVLILTAAWPSAALDFRHDSPPQVKADMLEDPLCYCLRSASPSLAPVLEPHRSGKNMNSAQLLGKVHRENIQRVTALPLLAPGGISVGGLLLGNKTASEGELAMLSLLCGYGAAVLSFFIREQRYAGQLGHFQDELTRTETEARQAKQQRDAQNTGDWGIIGQSPPIREVQKLIAKAAGSAVPVLVTGETGTGKELVASAIHAAGDRCDKAFLKLNCAAMPASLLESELFGYVQGAFSGAAKDSAGLLRSTDKGTLLLDEIGDMPLEIQAKLLRFLQDQQVRPVGGASSYTVNLRIIAATNCDLAEAVEQGTFRRDLYHRLVVFPITLPPLEQRRDDIPLLVEYFLALFARKYKTAVPGITPVNMHRLYCASYPGNVRELAANLERAFVLWDGEGDLLHDELFHKAMPRMGTLPEMMNRYEQYIITTALTGYNGNIKIAAEALGIPRRTLAHKLQQISLPENASSEKTRCTTGKQLQIGDHHGTHA